MSSSAIQSDALNQLFSNLGGIPLLTAEQEQVLARRIAEGDGEALQSLILANVRMVVRFAKPYRTAGMPFEDLVGEGVLGLIEAANRFDPDQGHRFITCAIWWVRKAIFAALRTQVRLVRVPAFQMRKEREVRKTAESLEAALGRTPSKDEVSEALSAAGADLDRVLSRTTCEFSLDQPESAESTLSFADRVQQDEGRNHESILIADEDRALVALAVSKLPSIERTVIEQRFGLNDRRPRVLREVGKGLGLSRERVRQIESRATDRLKRILIRLERPFSAAQTASRPTPGSLSAVG